jgi:hypothetical protein
MEVFIVPKITFIKNVDDEIIYPKTHEDAILTSDGVSISQKISDIYVELNDKANANHVHDYNTLINIPQGFIANGGNSDTVSGRSVDDTKTGTSYLWTSQKITTLLNTVNANISAKASIAVGPSEPLIETFWIDTSNNLFKYKVSGSWVTLGTELKYT